MVTCFVHCYSTTITIKSAGEMVSTYAKEWKNESGPLFNTTIKINPKRIKDLNVRPKTIQLLVENTGQKFPKLRFGNDFLDMISKAQVTKQKTEKLDFMKFLKFCTSKIISSWKKSVFRSSTHFLIHSFVFCCWVVWVYHICGVLTPNQTCCFSQMADR